MADMAVSFPGSCWVVKHSSWLCLQTSELSEVLGSNWSKIWSQFNVAIVPRWDMITPSSCIILRGNHKVTIDFMVERGCFTSWANPEKGLTNPSHPRPCLGSWSFLFTELNEENIKIWTQPVGRLGTLVSFFCIFRCWSFSRASVARSTMTAKILW